jgi:tetratricopeptide (TPR) repeat protein
MRAFLAIALLVAVDFHRLLAPTNSRAAAVDGSEAYRKGDYRAAERAFRQAASMRPGATASFDLGTAQIAAGNHEAGSAALSDAVKDSALAGDAFYNRGSSALQSRAYDAAIRDFEQSLRLRPFDAAARRNLEIALRRREQQRQQQPQQQQGQQQSRDPRQDPGDRGEEQPQNDAESLLRAVEQQEREELSRMRRSRRAEPRIGW